MAFIRARGKEEGDDFPVAPQVALICRGRVEVYRQRWAFKSEIPTAG